MSAAPACYVRGVHGNCARSSARPRRRRDLAARLGICSAWLLLLLLALPCCAPTVDTPAEASYRRDLRDAERIAAQLRHLPLVREAHVTLTRPAEDPLRPSGAATPTASASVVLDVDLSREGGADAAALTADARALVTAVAPEVAPAAVTVLARPPEPAPVLTRVGPFAVARRSRGPLLAALLGLLALCAGLGATLAARERSRRAGARTA
jgi:hypothetical protein